MSLYPGFLCMTLFNSNHLKGKVTLERSRREGRKKDCVDNGINKKALTSI